MYSDTHFHFLHTKERGVYSATSILQELCDNNCCFAQDIGTVADDLATRKKAISEAIEKLDALSQQKARNMLHFSAGVWPDTQSMLHWKEAISILKETIAQEKNICAIGECGLDHHWNKDEVDARSESDFTSNNMFSLEENLFCAQLELAKNLLLPVVIHSREAFSSTLSCVKNASCNKGIIHCFSYGIKEAKAFLDLGLYISISGSITYTKKKDIDTAQALLRYIPVDRLLLETDAPYLAPVPCRGQCNKPSFIVHTYKYCASLMGISSESLSDIVEKNIQELYSLSFKTI